MVLLASGVMVNDSRDDESGDAVVQLPLKAWRRQSTVAGFQYSGVLSIIPIRRYVRRRREFGVGGSLRHARRPRRKSWLTRDLQGSTDQC